MEYITKNGSTIEQSHKCLQWKCGYPWIPPKIHTDPMPCTIAYPSCPMFSSFWAAFKPSSGGSQQPIRNPEIGQDMPRSFTCLVVPWRPLPSLNIIPLLIGVEKIYPMKYTRMNIPWKTTKLSIKALVHWDLPEEIPKKKHGWLMSIALGNRNSWIDVHPPLLVPNTCE